MDSATENLLLQKIEELALDEDQVITNSVLCENLNICLKEAKLLLEKYVSDDSNRRKVSVTYIICGKLKTGDYGIQIVESTLLKEKKKLFHDIKNEIVYSIQKNNNIDFNLIAAVDNNVHALKGSIVSEKCRERTLETKILPPLPPQKNFEKQKPASFFKAVSKPQCTEDSEKIKPEPKSVKNNVKTQKATTNNQKLGNLTSFLSQSTQNKTKTTETKNSENEEVTNEGNHSKQSKVDMENTKVTSIGKLDQLNQEIIDTSDEKENSSFKENGEMHQQKRKEKSVIGKESNQVPKKRKGDEGKKRKRIIMDSDSDDDLFGDNEDERMVLEESDEQQEVVKPVPSLAVPKNKRRKAVEKTYEDEEGFIVTKTEYVLVSASEDEELETQKKPDIQKINKTENKEEKKLASVPKAVSKKKGKALAANQSSITNFFKKK